MAWGWWLIAWGMLWFVLYDTFLPYKLLSAVASAFLTPPLILASMLFCATHNIQ